MAWFGEINFTSLRNMSPSPLLLKTTRLGPNLLKGAKWDGAIGEMQGAFKMAMGKPLCILTCESLLVVNFSFLNLNPLIVLLPHWQHSDTRSSNWRSSRVPCALVLLSLFLLSLLFLFRLPLLPPPHLLSPCPLPSHTSQSTNSDSVLVMYVLLYLNIFLWICFSTSHCLQS